MDLEPYIENTANTPPQFGAYDVMHQCYKYNQLYDNAMMW